MGESSSGCSGRPAASAEVRVSPAPLSGHLLAGGLTKSVGVSLLGRLATIDRRLIYLLAAAIVVVTRFIPLGLPIAVSDQVRQTFGAIDRLPDDSVVVLSPMYNAVGANELNPIFTAFLTHCAERGYRILVLAPGWGLETIHPSVSQTLERYGYVYGQHYLEWGGGEAPTVPWIEMAVDDLGQACGGIDRYGQPLAELPLAQEVPRLTPEYVDVILTVFEHDTGGGSDWLTYATEPIGIPIVIGMSAFSTPGMGVETLYYSLHFPACIQGLRQCAEYEYLLGRPASAIVTQDVMTLIALMILVLVILANAGDVARRRKPPGALPTPGSVCSRAAKHKEEPWRARGSRPDAGG